MPKAAVVVFSELDSDHGEKARVVNALQIAREFKEAGDEVKVLFDGGGVTAAAALAQPEHPLHRLYEAIGITSKARAPTARRRSESKTSSRPLVCRLSRTTSSTRASAHWSWMALRSSPCRRPYAVAPASL